MPCTVREIKKFNVIKEEVQELQKQGEIPFDKKQEKQRAIEDLYARMREKYNSHAKELENLKKRLREATSQQEKDQLAKEIAELEKELANLHDAMEQMVEFMRDLDRRTISAPAKQDE